MFYTINTRYYEPGVDYIIILAHEITSLPALSALRLSVTYTHIRLLLTAPVLTRFPTSHVYFNWTPGHTAGIMEVAIRGCFQRVSHRAVLQNVRTPGS